jgi:phosphatidylserine/phosphatidylglycerophosphate/cardiolipin synthase-like enzyme
LNPKTSLLIAAIFNLARELPPAMLEALATELETSTSTVNWVNLARFGATQAAKERIHAFSDLLTNMPDLDGRAVAFAIGASAHAAAMISSEQRVEVAWTGPGTEAVPLRRVDQVLYELVEFAESEVVLVTYAAYRAERALDALHAATERGVRVMMVIELAQESGGKITFDGQDSICGRVPRANVFYWPLERRARSIAGAYGAMHVKCLIADRKTALVSSANLTDHALEMNMELGVLVRGVLPGRLAAHFDQLVLRGELVALHGGRA